MIVFMHKHTQCEKRVEHAEIPDRGFKYAHVQSLRNQLLGFERESDC